VAQETSREDAEAQAVGVGLGGCREIPGLGNLVMHFDRAVVDDSGAGLKQAKDEIGLLARAPLTPGAETLIEMVAVLVAGVESDEYSD